MLPRFCVSLVAVVAALAMLQRAVDAQNLAFSLFYQYLEQFQRQASIPGISVVIVQQGQIVSERGLGYRDLEGLHPALPDTPYPIADLTATITAALIGRCVQQRTLGIDDPIGRWVPAASAPSLTLREMVKHAVPGSLTGFKYDPARFALLAHPIEDCMDAPFRKVVAREIFDPFVMRDSVPGHDILTAPAELRSLFEERTLNFYSDALRRMATPYKVDRRGRATRSELPPGVNGSYGLIASARDLYRFDAALDAYAIVNASILAEAWTTSLHNGVATPFGMGWFVQHYQGEKLIWQHGHAPDASSLILKVPGRRLTLILLANSDGLSATYSLHEGDVTSSLFARTFLRLFL